MIFYYIPNDPAEPLIVVRDAGFDPRTSASEICCATNEPHTSQIYKSWFSQKFSYFRNIKKIFLLE